MKFKAEHHNKSFDLTVKESEHPFKCSDVERGNLLEQLNLACAQQEQQFGRGH